MADIKVSIANPIIGEEEINAVIEVMKSGMIAQGPKVAEFEKAFAEFAGCKHAIAVNSGTAALQVANLSAGIGPGDEVITSPFTFAATGNSILFTGAKAAFVDIDPETFTLDPALIEDAISENTKAIMPVQLYGQSADMDEINKIAKDHDLIVIEDAAQAHGAQYKGRNVGQLGDIACFSFYPTKNMTTSEGGMITTDDDEIDEMCRIYRAQGSKTKYHNEYLGYNFRMTDIEAAIGVEQLKKVTGFNDARIDNAAYLNEGLADVDYVETPVVREGCKHVYHQYTIKVTNGKRDELIEILSENGVGSGVYYPIPLYRQGVFTSRGYDLSLPVTEKIVNEVISLPIHPSLTEEDLDLIIKTIKEAF